MQTVNKINIKFHHLVLRGTSKEIGRQQGEMIKNFPQAIGFFSSGPFPKTSAPVDHTMKLMETYCPGLVDEMTGFCEAAEIPLEKLAYLAMTHIGGQTCSHFAVLPQATKDRHVLVGRNYDFSEKVDDLKLTTVFPEAGIAHLGFPTMFFGRNDGINERGLSVTMSAGGMPVGIEPGMQPPIQSGLQFWALIRVLLATCETVEEAEERIAEFPCAGNPILILADKGGHASLAEIHGPDKKITRINEEQSFVAATNHYLSSEMVRTDPTCMKHSSTRLSAINSMINENKGRITREGIKGFLGTKYPDGPCTHYYSEWFGTLHSCLFDLTACSAEVTFGSPTVNEWYHFDFNDPKPGAYESILPNEYSSKEFWGPLY